jgi:DNA-binding transcriptional LysR family regulator
VSGVLSHIHDERRTEARETGIDVAIRVGRQKDSTLIARKIGNSRRIVCASPVYPKRAGVPRHPEDLRHHNCLTWRDHPAHNTWPFRGPKGVKDVPVTGNVFVRSADALAAAAVAGAWADAITELEYRDQAALASLAAGAHRLPGHAISEPDLRGLSAVALICRPTFVDFLREQLQTDAYTQAETE